MVLPAIGMAVAGSAWNWWEQDSAYKGKRRVQEMHSKYKSNKGLLITW